MVLFRCIQWSAALKVLEINAGDHQRTTQALVRFQNLVVHQQLVVFLSALCCNSRCSVGADSSFWFVVFPLFLSSTDVVLWVLVLLLASSISLAAVSKRVVVFCPVTLPLPHLNGLYNAVHIVSAGKATWFADPSLHPTTFGIGLVQW